MITITIIAASFVQKVLTSILESLPWSILQMFLASPDINNCETFLSSKTVKHARKHKGMPQDCECPNFCSKK